MSERVDPYALWLRASLVASVAFLLGVAGHVSAGGLLPSSFTVGVLLAGAAVLSAALLQRPASRRRLVLMVVGGQTMLHVALSATAGHVGDPTGTLGAVAPASRVSGALPVVDGHRLGSLQDAYESASVGPSGLSPSLPVGHLLSDLAQHAPMMAVHLAVAALVGLWLARGERCFWAVVSLTGRPVVSALELRLFVPVLVRRALPPPADVVGSTPRTLWRTCPHPRRGPPQLAV